MLNKLRFLWQDSEPGSDSAQAARAGRTRTIVLALAALIGPPALLLLYYKLMFAGLVNSDALDFAQLGRNLSSGRGFVTYILRPLALSSGVVVPGGSGVRGTKGRPMASRSLGNSSMRRRSLPSCSETT